ncbi:hypothetical protein L1785_16310 [Antribacter sp. KLBMP9083]|uniref:VOC family protein n=1 Tax=Antribacter soli TaxID=2910976 RepID=A0AA41QG60_9MICO|nr:hypothetical protein [Antribacter soli]MCF4122542.1 hypothetical protein [Antribacter soli]
MGSPADDVTATARMIPMLPCGDVDELVAFWTDLGLEVVYRQTRPNPYVALKRGGVELHYYGMPGWDRDQNHSTCAIAVADTAPLHELFADGLRARYGRLPLSGVPRITRPRRRSDNAGLSGFSLVDPAGNWVRVSRAPDLADDVPVAAGEGATTSWAPSGEGRVIRALDSAVVLADSHGDETQARKILAGALDRAPDAPLAERAPALAYLAELAVRLEDAAAARAAQDALAAAVAEPGALDALDPDDRQAVDAAVAASASLDI